MTVVELIKALEKVRKDGWGGVDVYVFAKCKKHPSGVIPIPLKEGSFGDFGGWGFMMFGISTSPELHFLEKKKKDSGVEK